MKWILLAVGCFFWFVAGFSDWQDGGVGGALAGFLFVVPSLPLFIASD